MNIATFTPKMRAPGFNRKSGFTLIELLVVIAIIGVLAALVVGLVGVGSRNKKLKRSQVEMEKISTLIESYKSKTGIYPPDNPPNPGLNTLLYELAGGVRTNVPVSDPIYGTPFGNIDSNTLATTFGVSGLVNAVDNTTTSGEDLRMYRILKILNKDQYASVVSGTLSLTMPLDGPSGQPNPWNYLRGGGTNSLHNPETFDLWIVVNLGKTNGVMETRTIGNWKE